MLRIIKELLTKGNLRFNLFSTWPLYLFILFVLLFSTGKKMAGKRSAPVPAGVNVPVLCESFCKVFVECVKEINCSMGSERNQSMLSRFSDVDLLNGCYTGCNKHAAAVNACYIDSAEDCSEIADCLSQTGIR